MTDPHQQYPPAAADPGPRPPLVTAAAAMCGALALILLVGAFQGLTVIVHGVTATDPDKQASELIFGTLALLIAGGFAAVFVLGGYGLLRAGNPLPAQMGSVFACLVILGAARRALRFGGGPDLAEFIAWLIGIVAVVTILVLTTRPVAKEGLATQKRRWLAERAAKQRRR